MKKIIYLIILGLLTIFLVGLVGNVDAKQRAREKIYLAPILSVKTQVFGDGRFASTINFGLKKNNPETALFRFEILNSEIYNDVYRGLDLKTRAKMMAQARAVIYSQTSGIKNEGRVVDFVKAKYIGKLSEWYLYQAVFHGRFKQDTNIRPWPKGGVVERPQNTKWFTKRTYNIDFGVITTRTRNKKKEYTFKSVFKLFSGEDISKLFSGEDMNNIIYRSDFKSIRDTASIPVWIPEIDGMEDYLNKRYHKVRIEVHDKNSFANLSVNFHWKSRWTSRDAVAAHILGTNDSKIIGIFRNKFGKYVVFAHGEIREKASALELLVPHGESISIRIVKEGYYYLKGTFKVIEDIEKIALLDKVGQKIRKDHGSGSCFE